LDVRKRILAGIASDPTISVRDIRLDVSRKGFLQSKRVLQLHGFVPTVAQKYRVLTLAQLRAGTDYEIMDHLLVSESLWEG